MKTKIYVTNVSDGHDIFETGYFLTAEEAEEQMAYNYNHLTARERKTHSIYAEAHMVEHEETLTPENIVGIYSDWVLEQCWTPDPVEVIEYQDKG